MKFTQRFLVSSECKNLLNWQVGKTALRCPQVKYDNIKGAAGVVLFYWIF